MSEEKNTERRAQILVLAIAALLVLGCALALAAMCGGTGILSCIG